MDLCEIQETIKKHITVIKKTIIKPLGFDVIIKVPKKGMTENEEKKQEESAEVKAQNFKKSTS